tara:strand:+ start:276 stop:443 length:168 start_codon:yes stop_codon:yes gene_type:complete
MWNVPLGKRHIPKSLRPVEHYTFAFVGVVLAALGVSIVGAFLGLVIFFLSQGIIK